MLHPDKGCKVVRLPRLAVYSQTIVAYNTGQILPFGLPRYDNLKSAVKKILRGYRREETARFIAFRSHWRFMGEFCSPYEAHEKGGIENEAGYFWRNHWVPLPKARDLEDLNAQLLTACHADERRQCTTTKLTK
jgi:transposase